MTGASSTGMEQLLGACSKKFPEHLSRMLSYSPDAEAAMTTIWSHLQGQRFSINWFNEGFDLNSIYEATASIY